jgi:hypothetical protein
MGSISDVPQDVLASHVLSHLPFDKLCACACCGGVVSAAALAQLREVSRVRTLQELKFRERAVDGAQRMSKEHFVNMLTTMRGLRHVVCDSTVVADGALANLVQAMRETEALLGRQVQQCLWLLQFVSPAVCVSLYFGAQFLSLSLKYTRLTDEQLRFFPRYLVSIDLSHCSAFTAHRLSKLLACCRQLRSLGLNSCPAAGALFSSEALLGAACEGMQVRRAQDQRRQRRAHGVLLQALSHLDLAGNSELDGKVRRARHTIRRKLCRTMLVA